MLSHWSVRTALSILPVAAVSWAGQAVTRPAIPTWYEALAKPALNPPNAVFGPVWTTLFVLMAYAVWRILALPPGTPGRGQALAAFFVQLGLNWLWSFTFFGMRSPAAAAAVVAVFLLAILLTINRFWRLDRVAGGLLIPYALWVGFATYLNLAIWRLNG